MDSLSFELVVALYGALVATAVAGVQLRQYLEDKNYVNINTTRYYDLDSENVVFKMSNRSRHPVEFQEVLVYNLGLGGEVGFHELSGHPVELFKEDGFAFGDDGAKRSKPIKLPFRLEPGEAVFAEFSSVDSKEFEKSVGVVLPGHIASNLFSIEVSHARSDVPSRLFFELEKKYLSLAFVDWRKLVAVSKRVRYRPISRALQMKTGNL